MAGRGIDALVLTGKNGTQKIVRKMRYPPLFGGNAWLYNESVDRDESKGMSVLWKKLSIGLVTPTDVVKALLSSKKHEVRSIQQFSVNGNILKVSDIYPDVKGEFYCFFKKNGPRWSLLQVGAKSVKEMTLAGEDFRQESHVPLIAHLITLEDNSKEFHFPNF